jgi:hypothetical protein
MADTHSGKNAEIFYRTGSCVCQLGKQIERLTRPEAHRLKLRRGFGEYLTYCADASGNQSLTSYRPEKINGSYDVKKVIHASLAAALAFCITAYKEVFLPCEIAITHRAIRWQFRTSSRGLASD